MIEQYFFKENNNYYITSLSMAKYFNKRHGDFLFKLRKFKTEEFRLSHFSCEVVKSKRRMIEIYKIDLFGALEVAMSFIDQNLDDKKQELKNFYVKVATGKYKFNDFFNKEYDSSKKEKKEKVKIKANRKNYEIKDLVDVNNKKIVTTSLKVADYFGKNHFSVLRAIKKTPNFDDFNVINFEPISYVDSRNRKKIMYLITRSGFSFIAMGFTGREADQFKINYINAFDMMEDKLKKIQEKEDGEFKKSKNNFNDPFDAMSQMNKIVGLTIDQLKFHDEKIRDINDRLTNIEKVKKHEEEINNFKEEKNKKEQEEKIKTKKIPIREKIDAIVNAYCMRNNIKFTRILPKIYEELKNKYSFDVMKKFTENGFSKSPMDIIEEFNKLDDLYLVVLEICKLD